MKNVGKTYIHAITDGRDTPPDSGAGYVKDLSDFISDKPGSRLVLVDSTPWTGTWGWNRTETAYKLYTKAEGRTSSDAVSAVMEAYAAGETDEFIKPVCINPNSVFQGRGRGHLF